MSQPGNVTVFLRFRERKEMLAVLGEISKRGWWRECPAQPAQQELKPLYLILIQLSIRDSNK